MIQVALVYKINKLKMIIKNKVKMNLKIYINVNKNIKK